MWHGGHPGTGVIILLTGFPGDLTTGTSTMGITHTGIPTITAITAMHTTFIITGTGISTIPATGIIPQL